MKRSIKSIFCIVFAVAISLFSIGCDMSISVDGDGNIVPVACRFAADILRRREPCVGQEGERGEHAAVRAAGGAGGVPAVELLTRRSFDFGR